MFDKIRNAFQSSIRLRMNALFAALILAGVMSVITGRYALNRVLSEAPAINIAGSERMRTYKLAFLAHLYYDLEDPDARAAALTEMYEEIARFERYLEALQEGSEELNLLPAANEGIATELGLAEERWQVYRGYLEAFMAAEGEEELFAALQRINAAAPDLVQQVDTAVNEIEVQAKASARQSQYLLTGFLLFGLLLVVMAFLGVRRVTLRLSRLAATAEQVAKGDLGLRHAVAQRDEVGTVGDTLNRVTERLQGMLAELEQRVEMRTRDLRQRAVQLEAASEVARQATAIRELEQLLTETVHLISERFGFYHAGIFLLDDAGEYAVLEAASSEGGQRMLERGHRLRVGEVGIVGYAAGTGRPRIALDVGQDAVYFDNPDLPQTRSEMAVPLMLKGEIVGVLDVQSTEPAAFTEEDVEILRLMADQIAVAIENARLLAQSRRTVERLQRYQEEEVISGWRRALARRNQQLTYLYDRVEVREEGPEAVPLPVDPGALREVQVVRQDGRYHLLAPVRLQERTLGVLTFESEEPWGEDARRLVEAVVAQLSLALENVRLLEDSRLSAAQERARSEIVSRVRASVQIDAILRSAAEELGRALEVERARLQLVGAGLPGREGSGGENRRR
ncbi:MAG: GAF domain-containing protein [Anaerolineae bacterium]